MCQTLYECFLWDSHHYLISANYLILSQVYFVFYADFANEETKAHGSDGPLARDGQRSMWTLFWNPCHLIATKHAMWDHLESLNCQVMILEIQEKGRLSGGWQRESEDGLWRWRRGWLIKGRCWLVLTSFQSFSCLLCLVPQSCPTHCDPMDYSPPGSSVHGDSPGRFSMAWAPCPPPGDLPYPGIKHRSPALQADSLLSEPPGKLVNIPLFMDH